MDPLPNFSSNRRIRIQSEREFVKIRSDRSNPESANAPANRRSFELHDAEQLWLYIHMYVCVYIYMYRRVITRVCDKIRMVIQYERRAEQ